MKILFLKTHFENCYFPWEREQASSYVVATDKNAISFFFQFRIEKIKQNRN